MHVLNDPANESTKSDIALIDIAAGYFARLELATEAQHSVPFVREVARLAHMSVDNYHNGPKSKTTINDVGTANKQAPALSAAGEAAEMDELGNSMLVFQTEDTVRELKNRFDLLWSADYLMILRAERPTSMMRFGVPCFLTFSKLPSTTNYLCSELTPNKMNLEVVCRQVPV